MEIDPELSTISAFTLEAFGKAGLKIATAESCTGGLIAALLTSHAGSSSVFDRGFVTYSNAAKTQMLGVEAALIQAEGAVSGPVAAAMATGALVHSDADAAVSVTGIAGPGGGSPEKPVGLVYVAVATRDEEGAFVEEFRFENNGRDFIRNETAKVALEMLLAYAIMDDNTDG